MNSKKRDHLEKTYERILNVGFCMIPYEDLSDIIAPDPMVYGTAKDERILSYEGIEALFKAQQEQIGDMKPSIDRKRIILRISNDGNQAIIVEEITLTITSPEVTHTIFMRASCVMEYLDNRWKLTHWHTSTPVETENDPWHMEEWKREKEKLQQLVDEQTKTLKQNNRELQIEAALERVRSRSLAMHHSSELSAVVDTLLQEFTNLEFTLTFCIINLIDEQDMSNTVWAANPETGKDPESYYMKFEDYPFHHAMWDAWKAQKKRFVYTLEGEEKKIYDAYLYSETEFQRFPKHIQEANKALEKYVAGFTFFKYSGLQTVSVNPISEDELEILERFGRVFEQAYTRFLDLQKAEAQAREAQIETALEKVRSRTMAMQKGEELQEVAVLLYKELIALGVTNFVTCGYVEVNEATHRQHTWVTSPGGDTMGLFHLPLTGDDTFDERYAAWKNQQTVFHQSVAGQIRSDHLEYAITTFNSKEAEEMVRSQFPDPTVFYCFNFSHGYLHLVGGSILEKEEEVLLARFTKVFEQTYTRFLDLKKAEEQAKEAQIEVALEKVRSRTMGMRSSDELPEVANMLFLEVQALGINAWSCGYNILDEDKKTATCCMSSEGTLQTPFQLRLWGEASFDEMGEFINNDKDMLVQELGGEALVSHYAYMKSFPDLKPTFDELDRLGLSLPTYQINHLCKFSQGFLLFITYEKVPDAHDIFKRFTKVFDQTYTRFLDLKKAENQAKEAEIETALEKVRSVALSLVKPDDMLDIAKVLYEQLYKLGFSKIRNAIIDIHDEKDESFLDYDYSPEMSSSITKFSFYGDPVSEKQIKKTKSSDDAFFEIELKGQELKALIKTRIENGEKDDPRLHQTNILTYNLYSFGNGAIGISNFGILSDDQKDLLKRFRNVFTFAYKRYADLANAEAQAKEAKVEAALERVRSVALGIEESSDLLQIAKALYEQLLGLGFNDIRNAIIDVNNEDEQTFLDYDYSHEMGGTITLMDYDDDPALVEQVKDIAKTTDGYSEMIFEGQKLQDLINMRRNNGEADDPRLMKAESVTYILYAFGNGAMGISNFGNLDKNKKSILSRFSGVFAFAYKRFKDLKEKEEKSAALLAEKLLLEETLLDLKETQKQLIHSEKMASLGELTAGIAHEIQNPLNFVNNFSEVSVEMMQEVREEIANIRAYRDKPIPDGALDEISTILDDIESNLDKINHHGKRADGIVKGMLQHSRAGSDKKEPTDINLLADEYLRLAYHGLRAKDKSFNAELVTNFDKSLQKINVVPQDIGRVILNLLTNAFYAVHQKKQTASDDFKPTVSITTKQFQNEVNITVSDNGNGMTDKVKEKIFQPFFTTKPTGQGTGLGLSMSYDIVTKGHGGDIMVESKEGEGTKFIIQLPI